MGEIITFYSYKGGTGRSMALANVGYILARHMPERKKVLMIDWDLEAPGLHRYFYEELKVNFSFPIADYDGALSKKVGLIDFLRDVMEFYKGAYPSGGLGVKHAETTEAEMAFGKALSAHPLERYILDVVGSGDDSGLFLMKAGNQSSSDYVNLIRTFDWHGFYDRYGSFFTYLREHLESEYDAVLIDSRTGLTDIGDICTRVMPEKLVTVFVPNEQNIEGLLDIVRRAAEHRMNSRDSRGLVVYPLASRIDATASRLRSTWWKGGRIDGREIVGYQKRFEDLFKSIYQLEKCDLSSFFDRTQIPYDSDYAFGERVAARDGTYDKLSIGFACTNLTRQLSENRAPWEKEFDEVKETPMEQDRGFMERRTHVVFIIHGVQTRALWQNELRQTLQKNGFTVQPISYGYFDIVRFLFPWQLFAGTTIDDITKQVRLTVATNRDADFSILAESFGTFVVARILRDHPDFEFNRIIFCGSVIPHDFRFEEYRGRFTAPCINEVGSRDFWPVIAEAITFGYGSAGTYGFRRPAIFDRWHAGKTHVDFLNQQFCEKYWVPFFRNGVIIEDSEVPARPPWWLSVLSTLQIKYFVLIPVGVLLWRWGEVAVFMQKHILNF
jgi:pimeloyl-ACP methyl ester carboxylesterase